MNKVVFVYILVDEGNNVFIGMQGLAAPQSRITLPPYAAHLLYMNLRSYLYVYICISHVAVVDATWRRVMHVFGRLNVVVRWG